MPFKTFNNWLFDGNLKSKLPTELLLNNSPISNQYAIRLFLLNADLNEYLNDYFNNFGLWYISKGELFTFLKRAVIDFKISRRSIPYIATKRYENKLFDAIKKREPLLKDWDVLLLCDIINESEDKDIICYSLGLSPPPKVKKIKKSKTKKEVIPLKEFLESFVTMDVA